jgi:CysZ protein
MSANPVTGAGYLLEGIRLIASPGLRRFVIVPLLVNILVFAAGIGAGVVWFEGFVDWMDARVPSWLQWLDWLIWPLFVLLLLILVFYGFALVANLIAAPFNSLLAEQVERHLTGQPLEQTSGLTRVLKGLLPALLDELRKVIYALVSAIPFLVLLFVPIAGPVLWFLYTAWILSVQYADYPMGNHGLKFREMRRRLKERRLLTLGFGAATAGLSMIPVLNFIDAQRRGRCHRLLGAGAAGDAQLPGCPRIPGGDPGGAAGDRSTLRGYPGRAPGRASSGPAAGSGLHRGPEGPAGPLVPHGRRLR